MARTLVLVLIAAIVGGGAVYGVMLYLDRNPVDVEVSVRPAAPAPEPSPTISPTPRPLPTDTPTPLPTATPYPTDTPVPPPTPTAPTLPTPTPTAIPPTEREIVVNAFAECDGQYSGRDKDYRFWAANSAIEEGRQTVAEVRTLVVRYCGGVFPGLTAAAMSPALATPQPRPTNAPMPNPTPLPTRTPVPTATPQPALAVSPDLRHIEEKRYMLSLINAERKKAGVGAVVLGDNIAAQMHAEAALDNCFSSHWGVDGLKPYMRYSLAGGYQSNGENGSGLDYCIKASDGYAANSGINQEIRETMDGWMNSQGHRRNLLDPQHKRVNIGIAWDKYNKQMYQHFEGDYVEYDRLPSITNGVLTFSGKTRNGAQFNADTGQQIFYDAPPYTLSRGQVARTYCYDNGRLVAGLRKPLTGGWRYNTHEFSTTYSPCPDPYDVPANASPARSYNEAHQLWRETYNASQSRASQSINVPWITATQWDSSGASFAVQVNIGEVLRDNGSGVYTVTLWGKVGGEDAVISQYSIFHDVTPPNDYRSGS